MKKIRKLLIGLAGLSLSVGAAIGVGLNADKGVKEAKADDVTYTLWVEFKDDCRWDAQAYDANVKIGFHIWNNDNPGGAINTDLVELTPGVQFVKFSFTTNINPNRIIAGRFKNNATSFTWDTSLLLNRSDKLGDGVFYQSNGWLELKEYKDNGYCESYTWQSPHSVSLYVNGSLSTELDSRKRGDVSTKIEAYKTDINLALNDTFEIDVAGVKYATTSVQDSIAGNFDLTGSKPKCLVPGSYDLYFNTEANTLWIQMAADAEAEAYADYFLTNFTCGGTTGPNAGTVTAVEGTWTTLSSKWTPMTSGAKAYFNVQPDEEGTKFQQVLARYKYVIEKYGTGEYSDFMGKGYTKKLSAVAPVVVDNTSANTALIAIITISAISLLAVGGYFFIRSKKEDR